MTILLKRELSLWHAHTKNCLNEKVAGKKHDYIHKCMELHGHRKSTSSSSAILDCALLYLELNKNNIAYKLTKLDSYLQWRNAQLQHDNPNTLIEDIKMLLSLKQVFMTYVSN